MIVRVKDFNCISDIVLDFEPGFNVIQGPSNSGKSSIIRAIEKCIFNLSGSSNVRQGQDNLLIGIRHNGHDVFLTKGKNTKYKIDNKVFEKIGVNQLEEVADALNIREVVLGGEKVRLNFSNQFSYPFLLDKTPGQLYKFIVDSAESESLSDVLKDMSRDIKDLEKAIIQNEAQIEILTKQKIDVDNKLSNSNKTLEISNRILEMDSTYNSIKRELELRDLVHEIKNDISAKEALLNKLFYDKDSVSNLDQLYSRYIDTNNKSILYKDIKNSIDYLDTKINQYNNLNVGDVSSNFDHYTKLAKAVESYHKLSEEINSIHAKLEAMSTGLSDEKEKLNQFKVCPLCGGDLKC